jgi:hypothetical protein
VSKDTVLVAGGLVEIAVALSLIVLRSERPKLILSAWISSLFAIYRLGLRWVGFSSYCGCLGGSGVFGKSIASKLSFASDVLLVYLLCFSYFFLGAELVKDRGGIRRIWRKTAGEASSGGDGNADIINRIV